MGYNGHAPDGPRPKYSAPAPPPPPKWYRDMPKPIVVNIAPKAEESSGWGWLAALLLLK